MANEARLLLDSSILLELLLDQARAEDVARFFEGTTEAELYVTDFAVHSVAIMLVRRKRAEALARFVDDMFSTRGAQLIKFNLDEVAALAARAIALGLDFDDAYQYVAAEKYGLVLVSFDADFDRTERGRKTPADVIKGLQGSSGSRGVE